VSAILPGAILQRS